MNELNRNMNLYRFTFRRSGIRMSQFYDMDTYRSNNTVQLGSNSSQCAPNFAKAVTAAVNRKKCIKLNSLSIFTSKV
jgi:hypothetical protein